ncbi:hypothetical protein EON63_12520, partial [archaeon]
PYTIHLTLYTIFFNQVLQRNYELKLQNEDYKNMDPVTARRDFMERVREYEKVYEVGICMSYRYWLFTFLLNILLLLSMQTIVDEEEGGNISYIKLVNVGQKVSHISSDTVPDTCTSPYVSTILIYTPYHPTHHRPPSPLPPR